MLIAPTVIAGYMDFDALSCATCVVAIENSTRDCNHARVLTYDEAIAFSSTDRPTIMTQPKTDPLNSPALTYMRFTVDMALAHSLITPNDMLQKMKDAMSAAAMETAVWTGGNLDPGPHTKRMVKMDIAADIVTGESPALVPAAGPDGGTDFKLVNRPKEREFIIVGPTVDGETLYWSNEFGWADKGSATRYPESQRHTMHRLVEQVGTEDATDAGVTASCWIEAGNVAIYIKREAEGVVVDMYAQDGAGECLGTTAVTYADAEAAFMEENGIDDDIDVITQWVDDNYPQVDFDNASPEDRMTYLAKYRQEADSAQPESSTP